MTTLQRHDARRLLPALALTALTALAGLPGACGRGEGGPFFSNDKHTYVSTSWRPWTISLIDTRTGEPVWSVDVPVGKQVTVQFREGSGPNQFKPDMMDWEIREAGRRGVLRNQIPVPPSHVRRLEPTIRPAPEAPGALELPGT